MGVIEDEVACCDQRCKYGIAISPFPNYSDAARRNVRELLKIAKPYRYVIRLGLATSFRWIELTRARTDHVVKHAGALYLVVSHTKSKRVRAPRM